MFALLLPQQQPKNYPDMPLEPRPDLDYVGNRGVTQDCLEAIATCLQGPYPIETAFLVTSEDKHGFLLRRSDERLIAVRDGFRSGYGGEAPRGLSFVLALLNQHRITIVEHEVGSREFERLAAGSLRPSDIAKMTKFSGYHPSSWQDYVSDHDLRKSHMQQLWGNELPVIPLALVDSRLFEATLGFRDDSENRLLEAFVLLEDTIRNRIKSRKNGKVLFIEAFSGDKAPLIWKGVQANQREGRVALFTGTYMNHRNLRAHTIVKQSRIEDVVEFLAINHLFRLEKAATTR